MSISIPPKRRPFFKKLGHNYFNHKLQKNVSDLKFDYASGQAYTETIVKNRAGDDSFWEYLPNRAPLTDLSLRSPDKWNSKQISEKENFIGTRSLLLTALEGVSSSSSSLTTELIQGMPLHLVQLLWEVLSERSLVSIYLWSIISVRLFEKKRSSKGINRYYQTISSPISPLAVYYQALTSKSFEFLTGLVITITFPISDLTQLSKLVNLVTLEIINCSETRHSVVSDLLVRAWSLSVSWEKSFQTLRILRLWNHWEVTAKSLNYLLHFPALALLDAGGCNFNHFRSQKPFGWAYGGHCVPLSRLHRENLDEYNGRNNLLVTLKQEPIEKQLGSKDRNSRLQMLIDMIDEGCAPLACLHLGPMHPSTQKSSWFLRVKDPAQDNTASVASLCKTVISQPPLKRQQRPVRRSCKRNLDDFLQEFS